MKIANKRIPTQVKRIIIIVFLLVVLLLALTVFNYHNAKRLMYNYLENEAVSLALSYEAVARNSTEDIQQNLQTLLEPFKQKNHIAYMTIFDRQGQSLAYFESTRQNQFKYQKDFRKVLEEEKITSQEIQLPGGEKIYDVFLPLHLGRLDRQEGENYPLDGSHPGIRVMRVGIYISYGYPFVHGALVQMFLVGLLSGVFGVLSLFQIKTLKDYFALQEQNKKQEKLAAIGTVTAGVAHEIRNPLGAVKGFAQLLAEDKVDEDEKLLYLQAMVKETQRLEGFLNQLLDYTRERPLYQVNIVFADYIQENLALVRDQAEASGVTINTVFQQEDLVIYGDPNLLKQVFLNLALNAIQAMPEGGGLKITTRIVSPYVEIVFEDQGPGLELGTEQLVFQPFFTTKEKGSGLGLAISQQIIEKHGGYLEAITGTSGGQFRILLPKGGIS